MWVIIPDLCINPFPFYSGDLPPLERILRISNPPFLPVSDSPRLRMRAPFRRQAEKNDGQGDGTGSEMDLENDLINLIENVKARLAK